MSRPGTLTLAPRVNERFSAPEKSPALGAVAGNERLQRVCLAQKPAPRHSGEDSGEPQQRQPSQTPRVSRGTASKSENGLYRVTFVKTWKKLAFRQLPLAAKAVYCFLRTGTVTSNFAGVVEASIAQIGADLDVPERVAKRHLAQIAAEGLIEADWKNRLVWIPDALLEVQRGVNEHEASQWRIRFLSLPECPLRDRIGHAFDGFFHERAQKSLGMVPSLSAWRSMTTKPSAQVDYAFRETRWKAGGGAHPPCPPPVPMRGAGVVVEKEEEEEQEEGPFGWVDSCEPSPPKKAPPSSTEFLGEGGEVFSVAAGGAPKGRCISPIPMARRGVPTPPPRASPPVVSYVYAQPLAKAPHAIPYSYVVADMAQAELSPRRPPAALATAVNVPPATPVGTPEVRVEAITQSKEKSTEGENLFKRFQGVRRALTGRHAESTPRDLAAWHGEAISGLAEQNFRDPSGSLNAAVDFYFSDPENYWRKRGFPFNGFRAQLEDFIPAELPQAEAVVQRPAWAGTEAGDIWMPVLREMSEEGKSSLVRSLDFIGTVPLRRESNALVLTTRDRHGADWLAGFLLESLTERVSRLFGLAVKIQVPESSPGGYLPEVFSKEATGLRVPASL